MDCTRWFVRRGTLSCSVIARASQSRIAVKMRWQVSSNIGELGSAGCGPRKRTGSFASSVEPQLVAEIRADPEYNQITPAYYQRSDTPVLPSRAVRPLRHLSEVRSDRQFERPKLSTLPC
jgi:hypothetical protein